LALHGLDTLAPLEDAGWRATGYRALPVTRPRYGSVTGPAASRRVVDGVLALGRPATP
jgi:hypothetical protein